MTVSSITAKRCWRCKQVKELSEFRRNKNKPDGLATECRDCAIAINAAYYRANKEKCLSAAKAYKTRNKEKRQATEREYYRRNRNKIRQRSRTRYNTKTDEILAQQKIRRDNNLAHFHAIEKERYWRHRDTMRERAKVFYQKNKQRWQMRGSAKRGERYAAKGTFTIEQLLDKFAYHGWRCYLCQAQLTPQTAHTDHRKTLSKGGSNWIANIAPACQSCNQKKYTKPEQEIRQRLMP